MTLTTKRVAILTLLPLLCSCTALGGPGGPSFSQMPSLSSLPGMSSVKIGEIPPVQPHEWANDSADVEENWATGYGLISMPEMEKYLNGLYTKLKVSAGVPDWPGKVYIAANTTLDAHSSDAGNIYLNLALVQQAESEDEIFGVMAHEFGHIYLNHQSARNTKFVTDVVGQVSSVLQTVEDNSNATDRDRWKISDSLMAVQGLADNIVIPMWERSTEEEADRFAVTFILKNQYEYRDSLRAFLGRQSTLDARDKSKRAAATAASLTTAVPEIPPNQSGQVLKETFKLNVSRLILKMPSTVMLDDHPDAAAREEAMDAEAKPLLPKLRVETHTAAWDAAKRVKSTAAILRNYDFLVKSKTALDSNNTKLALSLASKAASAPTQNDALLVHHLFLAMVSNNSGQQTDLLKILMRNRSAPHPSWALQKETADYIAITDPKKGFDYLLEQYKSLNSVGPASPAVIAAYLKRGDSASAKKVADQCATNSPKFRRKCATEATTAPEAQTQKFKEEARTNARAKNLSTRIFGN
jgi:Zn-dependent protease with chaperone function